MKADQAWHWIDRLQWFLGGVGVTSAWFALIGWVTR
jgi:hypothetical protein